MAAIGQTDAETRQRLALALARTGPELERTMVRLDLEQLPSVQTDAERYIEAAWAYSEAFRAADAELRGNNGASDILEHLENAGLDEARQQVEGIDWINVPMTTRVTRRRRRKGPDWGVILAAAGLLYAMTKKG